MAKSRRPHVQMPVIDPSKKPPSFWRRVGKFLTKWYSIATVAFTVVGWILLKDPIKDLFKSQQEIREEKKFIKGILIPDHLLYETKQINLVYGKFELNFYIDDFKRGEEFSQNLISCIGGVEEPVKMSFQIIQNRLTISTTFKDFPTENVLGIIHKNEWLLVDEKTLRYRDDDRYLEVIDEKGRVAFSLVFEEPNTLRYKGYFIGSKYTSVATDSGTTLCIPKNATNYLAKIDSLVELITPIQKY